MSNVIMFLMLTVINAVMTSINVSTGSYGWAVISAFAAFVTLVGLNRAMAEYRRLS